MPVKNKKHAQKHSTQTYLSIGEIRNNIMVLKNGGVRAVLKTSTINFNLKSEDEQNATIQAYQSFLNSLDFPIQIVIQSRKVDLDLYFQKLEIQEKNIMNPVLKNQTGNYIEYLKKLVEHADIMEKKFMIVIPADPKRKELKKNIFSQFMENISPQDSLEKVRTRYSEFKALQAIVQQRVQAVSSGLERCGLRIEQLSSQQLIDMYYQAYNPSLAQSAKIQDIDMYNIS